MNYINKMIEKVLRGIDPIRAVREAVSYTGSDVGAISVGTKLVRAFDQVGGTVTSDDGNTVVIQWNDGGISKYSHARLLDLLNDDEILTF